MADREAQFRRLLLSVDDRWRCPVPQHYFARPRKWRFDWAWPSVKVAVEVHGGEWSGGRHGTGSGIVADCEKARAAARLGWIVLPIAGSELDKRPVQVLEDVVAVLERRRTEAARG